MAPSDRKKHVICISGIDRDLASGSTVESKVLPVWNLRDRDRAMTNS